MGLKKFLLILILWKSSDALLIRSPNIYQNIIAGMNERYKFDSLTLIHGYTQYNPYENIELATKLVKLQVHFARLWVPTAIMSVEFFKKQEIPRLNLYQKPSFVFLNDFDELRDQLTPDFLTAVAKSERVSLIFFRDKTKAEDFFKNMFIPLNCQFMVAQRNQSDENSEIITEVYRFTEHGDLQHDFLTSWNPVTGMQLPKQFLHYRRKNFRGHNINVGWTDRRRSRNPLISAKINDVTGELLKIMKQDLNLNITFHKTKLLGNCYDNGTCTHAAAKLVSKQLDIIGEPVTTYRNSILDGHVGFSTTCYQTTENVFYKKRVYSLKWLIYGKLFHYDTWILLGIYMLMISIAIIFIEYKKKAMLLGQKVKQLIPLNVSDICFRVWSMFINQSVPYSKCTQIQILQFTAYALFIMIYAVYSAKLVSYLAASPEEIPFLSLKEAQKKQIFVVDLIHDSENSFRYQYPMDLIYGNISLPKLLMSEKLSRNFYEGFNRLCNKKNYILLDFPENVDYFKNIFNISCEIGRVKSFTYHFSYALQKDSVLKRYINNIIIKFKERGVNRYRPLYADENSMLPQSIFSINMSQVFSLFVLLMMNQLLSFVFLIFELIIHKLNLKLNQYKTVKSKRIRNIVTWSSKGNYRLPRRALKAKHRKNRRKFYRYC